MNHIVFMAAAVVIGALISSQPVLNAILARSVGTPIGAATISIVVALVFALVLLALTGRANFSREALGSVPWWVYFSGLFGTLFVAGGVVIAPVTGALLFFVCVVAGQLIGATLMDQVGAFGLDVRHITPQSLAGICLVLAGAFFVQNG